MTSGIVAFFEFECGEASCFLVASVVTDQTLIIFFAISLETDVVQGTISLWFKEPIEIWIGILLGR